MKYYFFMVVFFTLISCSNEEGKIKPEFQNITESVYSSATIQPDSLYHVYAIVAGILDNNLVEEGDIILKEETISQIINNAPKLNSQYAKLALDLAKENYNGKDAVLEGINEEIVAAILKLKNDSINFYRQQNLWNNNIGSKVDYDTKKLNYELSRNNLIALRSKYSRTKYELETAVKQAQNQYQTTLINTKDFSVKSKINGKVYALYKEPGELVSTMEPIASIGSASMFNIEMLVDEVDIVKINLQQEVLITLDAYNNQVYNAKVSKIFPKKDERNQTFKVEAEFIKEPDVLYPGLSGEANIIITKKDSVLTIPKTYIIDKNKVKTDNGFVTIKIGLENIEFAEVLFGINKNTYIYKPE